MSALDVFQHDGRDVHDTSTGLYAGFVTVDEARKSADWLNSGDRMADPEMYIWEPLR